MNQVMTAAEYRHAKPVKPNKRNKYGAKKTRVDGIWFASQAEANRYSTLKWLEKQGTISRLELQPAFRCSVNGKHICTYRADFAYFADNARTIEDVKGFRTPIYRLKKKMVEAFYPGVHIVEVAA